MSVQSRPVSTKNGSVVLMGERLFCTQEAASSTLARSTVVSEVKAVETLVCGTSQSGFKSRQTPSRKMPLNGRQPVLKTGVQATVGVPFGKAAPTIPPSSFIHRRPKSEAPC